MKFKDYFKETDKWRMQKSRGRKFARPADITKRKDKQRSKEELAGKGRQHAAMRDQGYHWDKEKMQWIKEDGEYLDDASVEGYKILQAFEAPDSSYKLAVNKTGDDPTVGMIIYKHKMLPITVELLGRGKVLAFMQIKWMDPSKDEFPLNKDFATPTIEKLGAEGILKILSDIERSIIDYR
jgi:hypothetical protein